jgi:uncharacterized protein YjbI with pentapeptide repeats
VFLTNAFACETVSGRGRDHVSTDCEVPCFGSLQAANLEPVLKACAHGAVSVSTCRVESDALAELRAEAYPDVRLSFVGVSGTLDLQGAQLHQLTVIGSRLEQLDLHDAAIDRIRVAPSSNSVPDAYVATAEAPIPISIASVDARSCHASTLALLALEAGDVDLAQARVDDALDLTWTQAHTVSLRFANVAVLEAARLTTAAQLDLFGARISQASLSRATLQSVDAETASIARVLSLNNTVILDKLDGYWFSAGGVVFNGARVGSMDLSYAHFGLVDIDSALGFESGPIEATGLHVDAISGDVTALTGRIDSKADADGAFHSIEAALRSGGRYSDANSVAFHGSWMTAGVAGKLPGGLAVGVVGFFVLCFFVAASCCKPAAREPEQRRWKVLLCALDIVLPSFVDIGALSAWTDYDGDGKKDPDVSIEGWRRTLAFIMRILGTMAFTYLLLYVTTLRG